VLSHDGIENVPIVTVNLADTVAYRVQKTRNRPRKQVGTFGSVRPHFATLTTTRKLSGSPRRPGCTYGGFSDAPDTSQPSFDVGEPLISRDLLDSIYPVNSCGQYDSGRRATQDLLSKADISSLLPRTSSVKVETTTLRDMLTGPESSRKPLAHERPASPRLSGVKHGDDVAPATEPSPVQSVVDRMQVSVSRLLAPSVRALTAASSPDPWIPGQPVSSVGSCRNTALPLSLPVASVRHRKGDCSGDVDSVHSVGARSLPASTWTAPAPVSRPRTPCAPGDSGRATSGPLLKSTQPHTQLQVLVSVPAPHLQPVTLRTSASREPLPRVQRSLIGKPSTQLRQVLPDSPPEPVISNSLLLSDSECASFGSP
jgi:hypothetical protein